MYAGAMQSLCCLPQLRTAAGTLWTAKRPAGAFDGPAVHSKREESYDDDDDVAVCSLLCSCRMQGLVCCASWDGGRALHAERVQLSGGVRERLAMAAYIVFGVGL